MRYNILEVHLVYKNRKLDEVAVLYQSNELGWVRASYCTTQQVYGYKYLNADEALTTELLDKVAGQGMNLPDDKKKKYFPGKRKWEK